MSEETKNEIKSIVAVEQAGACRKKVSIEVPEEAIKDLMQDQYKELRREMVLPGFRKGRAPFRLIEKRFAKDITEQTKLKILAETTEKALRDNEIDALGEPDINHEDYTLPESGSFKFEFEVNVRPEIKLPPLDAIELSKPSIDVSDEEVQERIESILKSMGTNEPRGENEAVQEGDRISCDVVITPEGGEPVNSEDTNINVVEDFTLCGKLLLKDLNKELVGAKVGEEKVFSRDIDENYHDKNFAGKTCEIKVNIKEITFLKIAELNDELIEKLNMEDEAAFRETITDVLEDEKERNARQEMAEEVKSYLLGCTDFELPESIVKEQSETIAKNRHLALMNQGLEGDELARQAEQVETESEQKSRDDLKKYFLMAKVADELEVEVSSEEINGYIYQLAISRGIRPEKIRESLQGSGMLVEIHAQMQERKAIDKIIDMNLPKEESDQAEQADEDDKDTTEAEN